MNCNSCGSEIKNNANFCENCGAKSENTADIQEIADVSQNNAVSPEKKAELGMKWHKFNAYFLLPLSAFTNAVLGVILVSKSVYKFVDLIFGTDYGMQFYFLETDTVKWLNVGYGVVILAMVFYYVYISFALVKFKKNAFLHVYISFVLDQIITLMYYIISIILMRSLIDFDAATVKLVGEIITTIVTITLWLFIYIKYYNKRKHLFIN